MDALVVRAFLKGILLLVLCLVVLHKSIDNLLACHVERVLVASQIWLLLLLPDVGKECVFENTLTHVKTRYRAHLLTSDSSLSTL